MCGEPFQELTVGRLGVPRGSRPTVQVPDKPVQRCGHDALTFPGRVWSFYRSKAWQGSRQHGYFPKFLHEWNADAA
jgi:hypothetical protein